MSLFISRAVYASYIMQRMLMLIPIVLMFPLDSLALVPTAAPPSLLSEVHLESQCSTDLALLHSQPSSAPPAQL